MTKASKMRRSTHLFCKYCKMNLCEYDQEQCDKCLIDLREDRVTLDTNETMGFLKKIECFFESKFKKMCCC